jgi:hypothetical protein
MTFEEILDQAMAMLQRRGRLTYSTLKRQFQLDDAALDDVKNELIYGQRLAVDEDERVLVWSGEPASAPPPTTAPPPTHTSELARVPQASTPAHLAEKILTSRSALEGERKQVTVLFADLEYRKFKRPFPPPASLASAPLPPAGASPPPALAAAGPRRRARPGRKPGDGPPLRRGLLGGDCPG